VHPACAIPGWGIRGAGLVRLHHPDWGGFLDRYGTGGVRAATFFATTPVFREALDHRLIWSDLSSYAARDAFDFDFDFAFPFAEVLRL